MVQSSNATDDAETFLAPSVSVSPDPTTATVSVVSQHRLQRIEVVNARGMLVCSQPAYGHKTDIDPGVLPAGACIVSVQTIAGTTRRHLVKQ